ncbi:ankyrin repeat-containing domain protein [Zopfochytrium polystomum]|nr:ankyrin repeat-containing domain protein [Zopfochytrium polystomum]
MSHDDNHSRNGQQLHMHETAAAADAYDQEEEPTGPDYLSALPDTVIIAIATLLPVARSLAFFSAGRRLRTLHRDVLENRPGATARHARTAFALHGPDPDIRAASPALGDRFVRAYAAAALSRDGWFPGNPAAALAWAASAPRPMQVDCMLLLAKRPMRGARLFGDDDDGDDDKDEHDDDGDKDEDDDSDDDYDDYNWRRTRQWQMGGNDDASRRRRARWARRRYRWGRAERWEGPLRIVRDNGDCPNAATDAAVAALVERGLPKALVKEEYFDAWLLMLALQNYARAAVAVLELYPRVGSRFATTAACRVLECLYDKGLPKKEEEEEKGQGKEQQPQGEHGKQEEQGDGGAYGRTVALLRYAHALVQRDSPAQAQSILAYACRDGNVAFAQLLVSTLGLDPFARHTLKASPFELAVRFGRTDAVRFLLVDHARPRGISPLAAPAARSPLKYATAHPDLLRLLVAHGADPRATPAAATRALVDAFKNKHFDGFRALVAAGAVLPPPRAASLVKRLMEHRPTVEALDLLVPLLPRPPAGALAKYRNKRIGWADMPPLHYAANDNDGLLLRRLHQLLGCPLDRRSDFGFTALHVAARRGAVDAAQVLIVLGADICAKDARGLTPAQVVVNPRAAGAAVLAVLRLAGGVADDDDVDGAGTVAGGVGDGDGDGDGDDDDHHRDEGSRDSDGGEIDGGGAWANIGGGSWTNSGDDDEWEAFHVAQSSTAAAAADEWQLDSPVVRLGHGRGRPA